METSQIILLVTVIVEVILGYFSKKSTFVTNNLIPVQNIAVGLIVAVVEWLITKDFNIAIATSGLFAGGAYDVWHNIKKIMKGE